MSVVDLVLLTVLFLYLVKGVWRGALPELCSVGGLVAGLMLASAFSVRLGGALARLLHLRVETGASVLFALLVVIGMLAMAILSYFLGQRPGLGKQGGASRVIGGLLGLMQGVALLAMVIQAQLAHPWWTALGAQLHRGRLVPPFVQLGTAIYNGGTVIAAVLH